MKEENVLLLEFNRTVKELLHYGELRAMNLAKAMVRENNGKQKDIRRNFGQFYSDLATTLRHDLEEHMIELVIVDNVIVGRRKGSMVAVFSIAVR